MSTHEDDDLDHDQEEINVDDVDDADSRISYGSNGSEIDLDGNGSCYDDSETVIRWDKRQSSQWSERMKNRETNIFLLFISFSIST